ncbi:MAG: ABC transporter substrate-binding protein [Oscillospiraceae bacterium]|nr:ABC transporter substrate-binding protein [Oscillospiraceae bacterium]
MKKIKIFISALLITAGTLSCTACGEKKEEAKPKKDLDAAVREQIDNIAQNDERLTNKIEKTDDNKNTIKWMATWDINPDNTGKNVPTELAVFQQCYNGEVEWIKVTFDNRYEKLAQAINSGDGVDFFSSGDKDAFPKGAVSGMFAPADDYIDFNSELWAGVKDANDSAMWDGKHYMTIVQMTGDNVACIYNKKTVAEAGLDDPAELYKKGKWDWDAFESMLQSFVDVDNQRYGLDGWWFEFGLMNTTGVPAIGLQDGKLVNNLGTSSMERVQNWLYELHSTGCVAIGVDDFGWTSRPEYIGEGKELFYPCGLYQFYTTPDIWKKTFGEDAFFVPMPKDPDADEYYIPCGMDSYVFVEGGQNPEGVAQYLNCKRCVLLNDELRAIADQQLVDDYGWSQEMIDMKNEMQSLADANPFIDFSSGVSSDCGSLLDEQLRAAARGIAPWNETFDSINATVDTYLEDVNSKSN